MGWPDKYWDAVDQLYWNPSLIGLNSVRSEREGDRLLIPASAVSRGGSLYARKGTSTFNAERMHRLEEPLNHIFDIAFGIAPDKVIAELFAAPFNFTDDGSFESLGREVAARYPEMRDGNTTQQDGFFVSERSLIGVELKIGSPTTPGQLLKYLALLASEARLSGRRDQLGLLFITPAKDRAKIFKQAHVRADGSLPSDYISSVPPRQINSRLKNILRQSEEEIADTIDRLRVRHISWHEFSHNCRKIAKAQDLTIAGEQTLFRLLDGLADAIACQDGCIPK